MPRIDINSPSPDEDFDITDDTIASESASPVVEAKPFSDFSAEKPTASPFGPAAEVEAEDFNEPPEVAPTEAAAPIEAAVTAAPIVQATPVESKPTLSNGPTRRPYGRILLEAVLAIAVVGLGLWSWTLYTDRQNLNDQLATVTANPQALVEKQTQALIDRVGLLMQLPKSETPTVAGVSDAAAAKQQSAFFANAANGDKVLMYVKAGEAILYRPSTNKIILVAPLTFNNAATTPSTTTKK